MQPGDINWEQTFKGASWFHITGITPALSQNAADISLQAVKIAKEMGLSVSCDYNYRSKLWKYGKSAPEVMTEDPCGMLMLELPTMKMFNDR